MAFTISGIQQLGVGVENVYKAWNWYRENFGFDILLSDAPGEAALMQPYTDNRPQTRHTILAYNMQGGGGLEIWQYTSRKPHKLNFIPQLGDLGTFIGKIKSSTAAAAYLKFKTSGGLLKSKFCKNPDDVDHFFVQDPFGNLFEVVDNQTVFQDTESKTGGIFGAIVGVSDIEKSKEFYSEILGYDTVIYDETGVFDDFKRLPGGEDKYRRVLLTHSQQRKGPFSNFLNASQIELVQLIDSQSKRTPRKIYDFKTHLWGDPGFIQICFDIKNMKDLKEYCESKNVFFKTDSNPEAYESEAEIFDMGGASGHFTYIEDPDGNLIEFVETYYIPILSSLNLGLNLKKKDPEKPLPNFVMGGLKFLRKGADYTTSRTANEKSKQAKACADKMRQQYDNE